MRNAEERGWDVRGRRRRDVDEVARLSCAVLFVDAEARNLWIDAVAASPVRTAGIDVEFGEPFVVYARVPAAAWGTAAVAALTRWAEANTVVDVEIHPANGLGLVRFTDGRTQMLLDGDILRLSYRRSA